MWRFGLCGRGGEERVGSAARKVESAYGDDSSRCALQVATNSCTSKGRQRSLAKVFVSFVEAVRLKPGEVALGSTEASLRRSEPTTADYPFAAPIA